MKVAKQWIALNEPRRLFLALLLSTLIFYAVFGTLAFFFILAPLAQA